MMYVAVPERGSWLPRRFYHIDRRRLAKPGDILLLWQPSQEPYVLVDDPGKFEAVTLNSDQVAFAKAHWPFGMSRHGVRYVFSPDMESPVGQINYQIEALLVVLLKPLATEPFIERVRRLLSATGSARS